MAINAVIDHVRRTALADPGAGPTDAQLVTHYLAARDDGAFAGLVRRHGPMVLGVARRVLGNEADSHDAFQATFLVFVRKVGTLADPGRVGGWLSGVAYNTARKAKAMNRTRRAKERRAAPPPAADPAAVWRDVRVVLDEELARLPESYRLAVVTCDLEGRTVREAARLLGWPQGTAATRLARGRALLARRLIRRGAALSVPALAAALTTSAVAVPPPLLTSTVRAAALFAAHRSAADVLPVKVATLTEGVLKIMFLSQLKLYATSAVALGALFVGAALIPPPAQAQKPTPPPAEKRADPAVEKNQAAVLKQLQAGEWYLTNVVPDKRRISVGDQPLPSLTGGLSRDSDWVLWAGGSGLFNLDGLTVARDAKVTLNGKPIEFKALSAGLKVALTFADGKPEVTAIAVTSPKPGYVVNEVDAKARTITVAFGKDGKLAALPVVEKVYVYLYDKGNEGTLTDLAAGMRVSLQVKVADGRLVVTDIRARK